MSEQKEVKGNLLSNISPPVALPSFVTGVPAVISPIEPVVKNDPTEEPFIPTTFTAAIPPSKDTSLNSSPSNLDNLTLNPEPVASALSPITQGGSNLLGWMKDSVSSFPSSGLFTKVAEKAKSSVNSIVTTLDPQMKEYLNNGGDVEVIVASDKDDKVRPIREAFQFVFGKATVSGFSAQPKTIAAQPVGYQSAFKGAEERIEDIRNNTRASNIIPVVAVENFIVEVFPDEFFDAGFILLTDPIRNITLKSITQMTPIPISVITSIKEDTAEDYKFLTTGYAVTVGNVMASNLKTHHSEWHKMYTSVNRSDMILNASKTLASLYKQSLLNEEK